MFHDRQLSVLPARWVLPAFVCAVVASSCGGSMPTGPSAIDPGRTPPGSVAETTSRSDDFERPDGAPGPDWAWQGGIGAPTIRQGRLGSTTRELVIAWWTPDTFGSDQFSEAVVARGFDAATTFGLQVFVRRQATGMPHRYGFHFSPASGNYELKYDGGAPGVVIASVPGTQFKAGDIIRIEARGNSLRGLLNGVPVISAVHDALTNGQTGVVINPLYQVATYAWESWRGGDLAPAASLAATAEY